MTAITLTQPRHPDPAPADPLLDALRIAYQRAQGLLVRAHHAKTCPGSRFAALLGLLEALGELEGLTSGRVISGASSGSEALALIRLGNLFRGVADVAKVQLVSAWARAAVGP